MDRYEHDLVVRHVPDDLHDVLGVLRAEAARRLVKKVNVGRADHIEADIQPLALAAAQDFLGGRADDGTPALIQPKLGEFSINAADALAPTQMRSADGGGEVEVFLDRQVLIERVVLRDVGDIFPERFVVGVKREVIEKNLAADRLELTGEGPQERAFAATAGSHHANHLAALDRERHAIHRHRAAGEFALEVMRLEASHQIFFLLDQPLGKVAAQDLAGIHANRIAIREKRGIPHRIAAHKDRPVGAQDFDRAFFAVVVAFDFQKHIASGAWG